MTNSNMQSANELIPAEKVVGDIMLNDMNNIQDKTKSSLSRTRKMIRDSKQVGILSLQEQLRQREQLRRINEETNRVEQNLKRSDKLIMVFRRRMALWRW